jgi:hypothetical protein
MSKKKSGGHRGARFTRAPRCVSSPLAVSGYGVTTMENSLEAGPCPEGFTPCTT